MKLTDEVLKKNLLMHIENATDEYKKERRKLLAKGVSSVAYMFLCLYDSSSLSIEIVYCTTSPAYYSCCEFSYPSCFVYICRKRKKSWESLKMDSTDTL